MQKTRWMALAATTLLAVGAAVAAPAARADAARVQGHVRTLPAPQPVQRVWVPGHWQQNGHQRVWVQGHWAAAAPRAHVHPVRALPDRDRDGIPDRYDRDRDGDGVPNARDRAPDNPRRR